MDAHRQSEVVHNAAFGVSVAFSMAFFWTLGGNVFWSLMFCALGLIIDWKKKVEIDISSKLPKSPQRIGRRFVALLMTLFSLLASLGAALGRASTVTEAEGVLTSTDALVAVYGRSEEVFQAQLRVIDKLPADFTKAREAAWSRAQAAQAEMARIQAEIDAKKAIRASGESNTDMFRMLAEFFHVASYRNFMVLLLMAAATAVEIAFWVTSPRVGATPAEPVSKVEPTKGATPPPPTTLSPRAAERVEVMLGRRQQSEMRTIPMPVPVRPRQEELGL